MFGTPLHKTHRAGGYVQDPVRAAPPARPPRPRDEELPVQFSPQLLPDPDREVGVRTVLGALNRLLEDLLLRLKDLLTGGSRADW